MAIRAPDGAKNSNILPTGQWYAPSAVNYSAISAYSAYSASILHILHILHSLHSLHSLLHLFGLPSLHLALSCIILHYLAP